MKISELKELTYVDETIPQGLRWKVSPRSRNIKIDDPCGCLKSRGYYVTGIKGKYYLNHRLIYALFNNLDLDQLPPLIDHIDRCKINNKISNLREATCNLNSANRKIQENNTSGVRGVNWCKRDKKWYARIRINGKKKHLGCFDCLEEAKKVYNIKFKEAYPEVIV
jgi:hypothetical protein